MKAMKNFMDDDITRFSGSRYQLKSLLIRFKKARVMFGVQFLKSMYGQFLGFSTFPEYRLVLKFKFFVIVP